MNVRTTMTLLTVTAILLSYAVFVVAENNEPLGAETVTVIQTETANLSNYPAATIDAEAGNLTELTITGISQTKTWQGYYGNVSGTIVLEDSQGYRFYDWTAAEPQGEIYASTNDTITWGDVECAPLDTDAYMAPWNTVFGITDTDYDAINVTYNESDHPTFYTGTVELTTCPTTYTYVNNATQSTLFPIVALTTDTQGTLIFTAILENRTNGERSGITGYDGGDYDFQLLVAEDGSAGNDATTPYYFWVELE